MLKADNNAKDRLVRMPELEKTFGVCGRTVRRKAETGELPPLKHIGRAVGMLESQIQVYFKQLREKGA